jgi:hypothetical protein
VSKKQAAITHRIDAVLVRHSAAERCGRLRHQGKLAVGVTRPRDRSIFFRDSSVRVDDARGRLAPRVSQIQLLTGRMTMWRTVARAYYDPRPLFDREAGNIDLALAKYRSDHWDIPAYVRPSKRRRLPPVLNGKIHPIVERRQLRLPFTSEPKESSARQCQDSRELEFEDLIAVAVRRFTKTSLWNDVRRFVSDTGARLAGRKAVRVFSFCIGRF